MLLSTEGKIGRAAFKAYDIRGRVPDELNEEIAYRLGYAFVQLFKANKVVVGNDIRLSSNDLSNALKEGLTSAGCDVFDIGLCGTEQIYFATVFLGMDGGIMVTASHNPREYNGMKLVRCGARPISGDSGLRDLEDMVCLENTNLLNYRSFRIPKGKVHSIDIMDEYISHLLSYINPKALKPWKAVVNSGNGCAGPVIDQLAKYLPLEFIKIHHNPDGNFPNGIPNPLLQENRKPTIDAIKRTKADIGIAWDGDFDRCFLFDEEGHFIEGYYIVGVLAEEFLKRNPGSKIIHDPRLIWNTVELVHKNGGIPIECKTGHAFIKERMRSEDAIYGGEMSAHHYFKSFSYCDSGMIPWLLILEIMSKKGKSLSALIDERKNRFPVSGEINRIINNPERVLKLMEENYRDASVHVSKVDGLSIEFSTWRFNLRMSNTESVLRLNIETKGDTRLLEQKTNELLSFIDNCV